MNKLQGFPSVYYLSLEESEDRREFLSEQFSKYDIKSVNSVISKRFAECDDVIEGSYVDTLTDQSKGSIISHIKALRQWLSETDEEYLFVCEDDVSFETVKYWDFTWEEFIRCLPQKWEIVQLLVVRDDFENKFEFRSRYWNDWALAAYIIRRDYAQELVNRYDINGKYVFNIEKDGTILQPIGENVIYIHSENCYSVPLFVEEVYKFNTTLTGIDDFDGTKDGFDMINGQGKSHITSYHDVLNWYKNKKSVTLEDLNFNQMKNTELQLSPDCTCLIDYIHDTENPQKNFNLARWYHRQGQTAAAISFYLRAADRTDNLTLAYECLLMMASCFSTQGNRDHTVKGLYQKAISILPKRPEAYFHLARYEEYRKGYAECYTLCCIALDICDFEREPLSTNVDYPGKLGILFQKAVSAYWWGKTQESIDLLLDLKNNYALNEIYKNAVESNLDSIGYKKEPVQSIQLETTQQFDYPFVEKFDWSSLSYEDVITIYREIVDEKVYRFWQDVQVNDIVLDVGASVGAYTISILDQKPKKVYCVEPSKTLLKALAKNCAEKVFDYKDNPLVLINRGIVNEENEKINIFGNDEHFEGITFKDLLKTYSITHVDFLKIDCEGGEYNIFKKENMNFLLNKVKFIAAEFHLNYEGCRDKFKNFRDNYLIQFKDYQVMSCTRQDIHWGVSIDIKDRIFDDEFIDNYRCEFMIYIKN